MKNEPFGIGRLRGTLGNIEGFVATARQETGLSNPDVTLKAGWLEDYCDLLKIVIRHQEDMRRGRVLL